MVLSERVATGKVNTATFAAEVERIQKLASPYNRWVMMAAAACTAAFFSKISGGIGEVSALRLWLRALGSFYGPFFKPGASQLLP
jgi:uncharacterized membrane protein YjjP (DUF1212 family)